MSISLRRTGYIAYASVLMALVGWFVADFPILRPVIALGFILYAAGLWRWPRLWLVAVPALLPLFDLAPWSGRFFFDEFDALVLLTAGVLALREMTPGPAAPMTRQMSWVLAVLGASYFLSTVIRLWPLAAITADSFANYTSPFNSLRVAKGFVWAVLLLLPLRQAMARYANAKLLLGYGFLIGLAGVALVSIYERWLFMDITDYRTTSTFSSMHTGDGPIDVWFAMTMPFLALLFFHRRRVLFLPLAIVLSLLSAYALLTTVSRGPIIAVLVAYGVYLAALYATHAHQRRFVGVLTVSLVAAALVATVALPILTQSSLGQRFLQSREDAATRLSHWRHALALRDQSIGVQLLGMGLGSFPAVHQQRSVFEQRAGRYKWVSNGANNFLTLWSGQNLYMGQTVVVTQNAEYRFSAKLRSSDIHPTFTVILCEVWMLTSANCSQNEFNFRPPPGTWQSWSTIIHSNKAASDGVVGDIFFKRPTKLQFFVSNAPISGVDVGEVSFKDARGNELLHNGDFARGADYWFWQVDDHLQWHTKNLAVNILFDQGWLGLIAVAGLLWLSLSRLAHQIANRDSLAAVFLSSMTGFMVAGITVSTFDQPRLALAFYLLCFAALATEERTAAQ